MIEGRYFQSEHGRGRLLPPEHTEFQGWHVLRLQDGSVLSATSSSAPLDHLVVGPATLSLLPAQVDGRRRLIATSLLTVGLSSLVAAIAVLNITRAVGPGVGQALDDPAVTAAFLAAAFLASTAYQLDHVNVALSRADPALAGSVLQSFIQLAVLIICLTAGYRSVIAVVGVVAPGAAASVGLGVRQIHGPLPVPCGRKPSSFGKCPGCCVRHSAITRSCSPTGHRAISCPLSSPRRSAPPQRPPGLWSGCWEWGRLSCGRSALSMRPTGCFCRLASAGGGGPNGRRAPGPTARRRNPGCGRVERPLDGSAREEPEAAGVIGPESCPPSSVPRWPPSRRRRGRSSRAPDTHSSRTRFGECSASAYWAYPTY